MTALAHPAVQSVAVPAVLTLALLAAAHAAGARRVGALAVAAALVAAAVLIAGGGRWPPAAALHKLPWLVAAGTLAALPFDRAGRALRVGVVAVLLGAGIAWLAWPQRAALAGGAGALLAATLAAAVIAAATLSRHRDAPAVPAAAIAFGAAGLAAVAGQSGSLAIAQIAGALAVACGVFAAWSLALPGARVAAGALHALVGSYYLLAAATVLLTDASPWSLALLALAPLGERALPAVARAGALRHAACAALAVLVPVLVAALLAAAQQAPAGPYYR